MIKTFLLILLGVCGGALVGTSAAAFITLLDIVPRLSQITNSSKSIHIYERTLVISTVFITLADFIGFSLKLNKYSLIPIGLIVGIFVGLLASALAEVLNVIPILSRRVKLGDYVYYIIFFISLGKVAGSFMYWIILVKYN